MKLKDTIVQMGGVFRCCLEHFGTMNGDSDVAIGDKASCQWCKQAFTMVTFNDGAIWKPDWQIGQGAIVEVKGTKP